MTTGLNPQKYPVERNLAREGDGLLLTGWVRFDYGGTVLFVHSLINYLATHALYATGPFNAPVLLR